MIKMSIETVVDLLIKSIVFLSMKTPSLEEALSYKNIGSWDL